jgi:hypothetical protein
MMNHVFCEMTALIVAVCCVSALAGDDEKARTGRIADDQSTELRNVRQLTTNATPHKLQELMAGANDTIAIRAAWENVRRQLAQDLAATGQKTPDPTLLKGAGRFVGFLEGRLRIPVPRWWALELANARAREPETARFFWGREVGDQIGPRDVSNAFGVVPTIERTPNGEVQIAWSDRKLRLPANVIPTEVFETLTGLVYRNRCVIAKYQGDEPLWVGLEIFCVDLSSSKVVWSSKQRIAPRPEGHRQGGAGASIHEVALVCRDDVVFVFGMEITLLYLEALKLSDGKVVMRFNYTY